jgi:lipopolysaccharide biosynthesis protein
VHFHYPELIVDFLEKLSVNDTQCDLLLSTNEEKKAAELRKNAGHFDRGRVEIRVVPNRGRDIAPLLTEYGKEIVDDYDVVGHFHGKRSPDIHATLGESWREFLWLHLLGKTYPMMDIALTEIQADDCLGLVFAEEPHLTDWSRNLEIAEKLAQRAGIDLPLPPFFEYPVGTMFWARTQVLAPLVDLDLSWGDYPEEPLPTDGTILHALERLLPFAARRQGLDFATLHISGISW